jgi:hypothetical protein
MVQQVRIHNNEQGVAAPDRASDIWLVLNGASGAAPQQGITAPDGPPGFPPPPIYLLIC